MIQNKLLYTVNSNLFPKVLKRLNDLKNTCIFGIADENIYHLTRENLKMVWCNAPSRFTKLLIV